MDNSIRRQRQLDAGCGVRDTGLSFAWRLPFWGSKDLNLNCMQIVQLKSSSKSNHNVGQQLWSFLCAVSGETIINKPNRNESERTRARSERTSGSQTQVRYGPLCSAPHYTVCCAAQRTMSKSKTQKTISTKVNDSKRKQTTP